MVKRYLVKADGETVEVFMSEKKARKYVLIYEESAYNQDEPFYPKMTVEEEVLEQDEFDCNKCAKLYDCDNSGYYDECLLIKYPWIDAEEFDDIDGNKVKIGSVVDILDGGIPVMFNMLITEIDEYGLILRGKDGYAEFVSPPDVVPWHFRLSKEVNNYANVCTN